MIYAKILGAAADHDARVNPACCTVSVITGVSIKIMPSINALPDMPAE
jgi:hypothetical protein